MHRTVVNYEYEPFSDSHGEVHLEEANKDHGRVEGRTPVVASV